MPNDEVRSHPEGTIFTIGFHVIPGADGTYVVNAGRDGPNGRYSPMWGFSSISDLIGWLVKQANQPVIGVPDGLDIKDLKPGSVTWIDDPHPAKGGR